MSKKRKTKLKKTTKTTKSQKGNIKKSELKEEVIIESASLEEKVNEKEVSNDIKVEEKKTTKKTAKKESVVKEVKAETKKETKTKKEEKKENIEVFEIVSNLELEKLREENKNLKKSLEEKDKELKKASGKSSTSIEKKNIFSKSTFENIINRIKERPKKEKVVKEKVEVTEHKFIKDYFWSNLLIVTLLTFGIEMIFRAISKFDVVSYASLRILLSTIIISTIIVFLSSLVKKRWIRNTIILLYVFAYSAYNWMQLGFMNFLGVYISFNTSSQALAVASYIFEFLSSFKIYYHLVFLPFILAFIYYVFIVRKTIYHKVKLNFKYLILLVLLFGFGGLYYKSLTLSFMQGEFQIKSNLKLFGNPDNPTVSVGQFGSVMFGIVDLRAFVFPVEEEETFELQDSYQEANANASRKVSPLLDELAQDDKGKYAKLNKYFVSQKVTDYNDYTGMFEGMNVVVVQIESGSWGLVNEKYFPNYYKMYSEGWSWENYYSPRNSCATGNNEFSLMTGLYSIYNTCTTNTYRNNTYYESVFGLFNDANYSTTSMHNFIEWYYYRKVSHKNMGSTYYGADALKIKTGSYGEWPSDIELMEKAFKIILKDGSEQPWMSWITTVTSHQPYSNSSTYGDKYMKFFKKEGYSTTVARYMSKLKVVDEALGTMLKTLEDAKQLDNTVIVMVPDHYPYGLKEEQLKEMFDKGFNDYEKERVPFVMYNSKMEPQVFEDYTSYVDVLPTIANLLNLEYDPRLYVGTDLMSEDHESLVIFPDGSWKNEYAFYDASKSKIKEYEKGHYSAEELKAITNRANLKISMSTTAIKLNYFDYLSKELKKYNKKEESTEANSGEIVDDKEKDEEDPKNDKNSSSDKK